MPRHSAAALLAAAVLGLGAAPAPAAEAPNLGTGQLVSTNTLQRFDPETERFQAYRIPTTDALVRQIVEVGGVIWGAESATERLVAFSAAS